MFVIKAQLTVDRQKLNTVYQTIRTAVSHVPVVTIVKLVHHRVTKNIVGKEPIITKLPLALKMIASPVWLVISVIGQMLAKKLIHSYQLSVRLVTIVGMELKSNVTLAITVQ